MTQHPHVDWECLRVATLAARPCPCSPPEPLIKTPPRIRDLHVTQMLRHSLASWTGTFDLGESTVGGRRLSQSGSVSRVSGPVLRSVALLTFTKGVCSSSSRSSSTIQPRFLPFFPHPLPELRLLSYSVFRSLRFVSRSFETVFFPKNSPSVLRAIRLLFSHVYEAAVGRSQSWRCLFGSLNWLR